jgi:hypothetical protein
MQGRRTTPSADLRGPADGRQACHPVASSHGSCPALVPIGVVAPIPATRRPCVGRPLVCTASRASCFRRVARLRGRLLRRPSARRNCPGWPQTTNASTVPGLATVTQQPGDATALPGSATPAEQLRRVNLIERQRDQSESEAVSDART